MAIFTGYVVEGHVRANDVKKMPEMKPVAFSTAVPGMPVGSSRIGIGSRKDPKHVLLFAGDGRERVISN